MVAFILEKLDLTDVEVDEKKVSVVRRRKGNGGRKRVFSEIQAKYIQNVATKAGFTAEAPLFFETMSLAEQVAAVRSSKVLVMRHGAGEANSIFMHEKAVLFEISSSIDYNLVENGAVNVKRDRTQFYKWPCEATGCKHAHVNLFARS